MTDRKSNCCNAPVKVGGEFNEGTHYYICTKCGKPCDVVPDKEQELPKGLTARLNLPEEQQYIYGEEALRRAGYIKLPEGIEIICLCGSTRFTREMLIEQWRLTKLGCVVLSWCALPDDYFQGEDKAHIGDQEGVKAVVDQVHFRKIDLSKEVRVMNIGGYIGESTTNELRYAISQNKRITFYEPDSAKQILSLIRQDKE